jgi:hypothetical protein
MRLQVAVIIFVTIMSSSLKGFPWTSLALGLLVSRLLRPLDVRTEIAAKLRQFYPSIRSASQSSMQTTSTLYSILYLA